MFGVLALLVSRTRIQFKDAVMALGTGAGSFGGQLFSVLALEQKVPGYTVFPITTGGNLFLVAAGGVFLFRERIGVYGIAGIVTGIASLVLLSMH
jgi:multidrug transporter EmrE-like cation transporter